MKQAVPDRWSVPMPGRAPGVVQLPPPLVHPVVPHAVGPAAAPKGGVSPLIVGTLAAAAGVTGALAAVLLILVFGATAAPDDRAGSATEVAGSGILAAAARSPLPLAIVPAESLVVDVSGGVMRPGLRTLRVGDRVGDAIAAAGGFAPRADVAETSRTVNLAQPLTDGMKVLVPELGSDSGPFGQQPVDGESRIDLNGASATELESLPGIGPVTAQKIVAAREEQPFSTVDDLRDRGVVGQSVFEDIRELVHVGGG